MDTTTIFITRYVADHAAAEAWYEAFFGRPCDARPVPNCREWHLRDDVFFQVIHAPEKAGTMSFAFGVADLPREGRRLAAAGLAPAEAVDVEGFDDLQWLAVTDPEAVETGLVSMPGD